MQRTKPAKKAHRYSAGPFASGRPDDDGQKNRNRHYPERACSRARGMRALPAEICRSPFFALPAASTRKSSAGWRAGWRLLGMQIWRLSGLRRVTLDPGEKCCATRQASRDDVADKRFAFHDRDIRLTRNGDEVICSIATQRTGCSEVKWNCYLMHGCSIQVHRSNPAANESSRFDTTAQAHDANVLAIIYLEVARQLRRDF